ncbi:MAG: hypothetical protein ABI445_22565, partial [Polyangia bacterium]
MSVCAPVSVVRTDVSGVTEPVPVMVEGEQVRPAPHVKETEPPPPAGVPQVTPVVCPLSFRTTVSTYVPPPQYVAAPGPTGEIDIVPVDVMGLEEHE